MRDNPEVGTISYDDLLQDDGAAYPSTAHVNNDKVAMLPYSSGTTGLPSPTALAGKEFEPQTRCFTKTTNF